MQGETHSAYTPEARREPLTETEHDLILGSRVRGTPVYNRAGEHMGHVHDLSIHKESGQVLYALMAFGGFLGLGENLHPLPWGMLVYDVGRNGYVVSLEKEVLKKAPSLTPEDLESLGAGAAWREELNAYYAAYGYPPMM